MTCKRTFIAAALSLIGSVAWAADSALPPATLTNTPSASTAPLAQPVVQQVVPPTPADGQPLIGQAPPPVEAKAEPLDAPAAQTKPKILWKRIEAGFALPEIESALVARHEAWYLNRPEYIQRMVERSKLYLYFIVEELEKRDMPTEIALLPMIESAFNPQALSRARASGIWQFIPSTGKKYGLQQNFWYDGRRDVLAATRAALDYLQFLHDSFGDWELALAAYNCGEGCIQRAIVKNRVKHKSARYAALALPRETRNYLPKLQAVKNIISNPEMLGFELDEIPNLPYFTTVDAPGHMDVVKAAALAQMPIDEFRSLNPAYNRPVMIHAGARQILVPVDKAEEFQANLKSNDEPLVSWQTYKLKPGETLEKVAAKFNIEAQRLKEVNGLKWNRRVQPGQMLLVPLDEEDVETNLDETYTSPDFQASPEEFGAARTYVVRRGDTLFSIARAQRTTVARIKTINGLKSNALHTGQRLTIYGDRVKRTAARRHHTVRRVSSR